MEDLSREDWPDELGPQPHRIGKTAAESLLQAALTSVEEKNGEYIESVAVTHDAAGKICVSLKTRPL